jgi:hypothetical protein
MVPAPANLRRSSLRGGRIKVDAAAQRRDWSPPRGCSSRSTDPAD